MSEQTPLMKQYLGVKKEHSDAIVLFRLGDFYEMFGDDAKVASAVLQIALTTREKNRDDPMPMCGIPYFASETYISKLIAAGYKVAICEQVEDPKEAKGIVKREVVRVITPGTHSPGRPKQNNYIFAFAPLGRNHGIALADISTGEFLLYETDKPVEDEIPRFEPTEVLMPRGLSGDIYYSEILEGYYTSTLEDSAFDYSEAYAALLRYFNVSTLAGFGCEGMPAAVSAAGALLEYLLMTQKEGLRIRKIAPYSHGSFMFLDAHTQRNLELARNLKDGTIEGTLLWALDETLTPMGGRFLRKAILRPLLDAAEIGLRQLAVKRLVEDYELMDFLRRRLRNVQDLERLGQKVDTGKVNARDIAALRNSLAIVPDIKKALSGASEGLLKDTIGGSMAALPELCSLIDRGIVDHPPQSVRDGGIIRDGFDGEVDELRSLSVNARDFIASIEARERQETGISSLKVGYNRIFGYYIEITKANLGQVPYRYIRKQTLVNAERFITEELKEYEARVLGAEDRVKALEYELFMMINEEAGKSLGRIMRNAACLAYVDFLLSLAVSAKRHDLVMPSIGEDRTLRISNGRHPVLERLSMGERFIPNDTEFDEGGQRVLLITGPNMAGKSTYMRQVALIVLMAQMGSFVPAENCHIGVVDRIFTRIGASDNISKGQSTFMVEMIETANLLNNASDRSLILLDEVGRGTSTFDGVSIAWATAVHIAKYLRSRTLFATHYLELTELSGTIEGEGIKNFNIVVREWGDEIVFLRKIEEGPADRSYGIHVARLAGIPEAVVAKAREVLKRLEQKHRGDAAEKRMKKQLDLFTPIGDQIVNELIALDDGALSPGEALLVIREFKKKVLWLS